MTASATGTEVPKISLEPLEVALDKGSTHAVTGQFYITLPLEWWVYFHRYATMNGLSMEEQIKAMISSEEVMEKAGAFGDKIRRGE